MFTNGLRVRNYQRAVMSESSLVPSHRRWIDVQNGAIFSGGGFVHQVRPLLKSALASALPVIGKTVGEKVAQESTKFFEDQIAPLDKETKKKLLNVSESVGQSTATEGAKALQKLLGLGISAKKKRVEATADDQLRNLIYGAGMTVTE